MAFNILEANCQLPDCVNGPSQHKVSKTCKQDLSEDVPTSFDSRMFRSLDNQEFRDSALSFYGSLGDIDNVKCYQKPEAPEEGSQSISNDPAESGKEELDDFSDDDAASKMQEQNADINRAINAFYAHWSDPSNQEKIFMTPVCVLDYVISSPIFANYRNMYSSCRLKFYQLEQPRARDLICNFISEKNIRYFQNFDIFLSGALIVARSANRKDLEILQVEFESKISYLSDTVRTVEEHIKTINSSHEVLRSSINSISEVSQKLSAEKRALDLRQERAPHSAPGYPSVSVNLKTDTAGSKSPYKVLKKDHLSVPITSNGELEFSLITQLNKGLSTQDMILFRGLNKLQSEMFLRAMSLSWSTLLYITSRANGTLPETIAKTIIAYILKHPDKPSKIQV